VAHCEKPCQRMLAYRPPRIAMLLLGAAVHALILNHVFCRYEETKLLQQYGGQYADYTANVRRWL